MSLSLPNGRLAESVKLRVMSGKQRGGRSEVRLHEDSMRVPRSLERADGERLDMQVEAMRTEAFLQLVNRRLV